MPMKMKKQASPIRVLYQLRHGTWREATMDQFATVKRFMLRDASSVLCGAVIFADGGPAAKLHQNLV